jgi:hypothetical protein
MKIKKLKKYIVSNPDEARNLILSTYQIRTLKIVAGWTDFNSIKLQSVTKGTMQNTAMSLLKLYNKGYLTRTEISSPSGGIEYIYNNNY